jgi:hypothetical protein
MTLTATVETASSSGAPMPGRSSMRNGLMRGLTVATCAALLGTSAAAAHPARTDDGIIDSGLDVHGSTHLQHGTDVGHISVANYGVELVSKLNLTSVVGRVADVGVHNGFAYLGAFRTDACAGNEGGSEPDGGVYVVDIRDPANPTKVGFIPIHQDSYAGEGIQAISMSTAKFSGDILVINAEACGKNDKGGLTLYDVTTPAQPRSLVRHFGDFNVGLANPGGDANDIHSAFMWEDDRGTATDADDRGYVVVVDDFELADVDIFDITDPRRPVLVGEFDLDARYPEIIDPTLGSGNGFFHDVIVKQIDGHFVMLVSYWDSGYVLLNVDDPANPSLIGDSDYANPDPLSGRRPEGNGHEAEFTADNEYIVAADEDFGPFALTGNNDTDATSFELTSGSDTPQLGDGASLSAQTRFVGRACPGDSAVPAASGPNQVAVVERGLCTFTEKLAAVEAAGGYVAVVVFNREGADGCSDGLFMDIQGNLPAFFVNRPTGYDFFNHPGYDETACRSGAAESGIPLGVLGDTITIGTLFDGWGYVRLYRADPVDGKLVELDQYAIPEAFSVAHASGFGDLSVHEAATSAIDPSLVYLSYYAGGFRILRIVGDQLVEIGAWIDPPAAVDGDPAGNNFWGVQVFQHEGRELVAASDRDFGLYIFERAPGD